MAYYEQCPRCDHFEEVISDQSTKISTLLSTLEPLSIPGINDEIIFVPQVHSDQMIQIKLPLDPTSKEESDYVKSAMFALNQKLKLLKYLDHEKEELTALYTQSIKNTKDIQLSAEDTYNQLNDDIKLHQSEMGQILEDISTLETLLKEEEEKSAKADTSIFGLIESKSETDMQVQNLIVIVSDVETVFGNIKNTQIALESTEKERQAVFKESTEEINRFRLESSQLNEEAKRIEVGNKELREKINKLAKELQNEREGKLQLLGRKLLLEGDLERKKALKILQIEEKEFLLNYEKIGDKYSKSINALSEEIKNSLDIYETQRQKLSLQDDNIKTSIIELHHHISLVANRIAIQEAIIEGKIYIDLSENNNDLQSKVDIYNKKLIYKVSYIKDEKLHEYLNQLSTKLLTLSDLFLLQCYQLNVAQKSASHLRDILQNTSDEIESLENESVQEQMRIKDYTPLENDQLDILIYNKIRELGKPLKEGIVRLDEGMYRIGEKRVKAALSGTEVRGNLYVVYIDDRSQVFEEFLNSL